MRHWYDSHDGNAVAQLPIDDDDARPVFGAALLSVAMLARPYVGIAYDATGVEQRKWHSEILRQLVVEMGVLSRHLGFGDCCDRLVVKILDAPGDAALKGCLKQMGGDKDGVIAAVLGDCDGGSQRGVLVAPHVLLEVRRRDFYGGPPTISILSIIDTIDGVFNDAIKRRFFGDVGEGPCNPSFWHEKPPKSAS